MRDDAWRLVQAVPVTIVGVLPVFLVGALAVQLRADLGIGPGALGLATAAMFAVSGSLSRPLGALVQRIGSRGGMTLVRRSRGLPVATRFPRRSARGRRPGTRSATARQPARAGTGGGGAGPAHPDRRPS